MKARIYNIQRYCLHDGDGIRTTIFFKGCPLKCQWCSNPESQAFDYDVFFDKSKCINCRRCRQVCPNKAESLRGYNCNLCYACANICYSKALVAVGTDYEMEEIVKIVERDMLFYELSDGGVTFSGGEPLMQAEALCELATKLKFRGINLAIETCGYSSWEQAKSVFALIDQILFDVKIMDPEKHAEFTGVRNDIIIDNFRKAAQLYNEKIIIRVPFIEGINDDDDNIQRLQRLMRESNVKTIVFLPYHRLGEHKYKQLGKTYNFDAKPPTKKRMEEVCQSFEEQGLTARIHG